MANNNYDRMLLGEKQAPTAIPNKAKEQRKAKRSKKSSIVKIVLLVVAVLVGLATVGAMGVAVQGFMLGVFGWLGIAYALAVVLLCSLSLAGVTGKRKLSKSRRWIVAGISVMVFLAMLFAHLWSSYAAYDAVLADKGIVSYGDYLGYVYHHGMQTAGGALLSLLAYPFLNAVGLRLSGIIFAVLFFAVLFALIYPFWLTTKERRVIAEEAAAPEAPRLFVDTVDGDQRANKARGKKRAASFDYSYPNGNDPIREEPEALDLIDEEEGAHSAAFAPDTPEARRQNAMELLLGLKDESTRAPKEETGYNPAEDKEHPLQFGTRQNTHADWARPAAPEVDRDQMPEAERKQQSYDILFGEAPAPKSFAAYEPVKQQPKHGLAAGDTIETVVPSARDAQAFRAEKQGDDYSQNIYKISDNGSYVNARNAHPEPTPATNDWQRREARPGEDSYAAPEQRAYTPEPAAYTPRTPEPAVDDGLYYGNRPMQPEEANTYTPKQYPTFEEESSLDHALHQVQDDYEEEEETPVVDRNGYVEREESDTPQPSFNGFVQRQVKETPPEEEPEDSGAMRMRPQADVKPRFTAIPDDKTKQAARAFAPDPKEIRQPRPYVAPPLYLLKDYPPPADVEDYEEMSKSLEEAFASYNIEVHVIGYTRGPTFTQYAVRLADGVPFKRVSTLGQDIVRKMCLSEEINIVPKVPNMDAIGVEIINKTRSQVGLKPLLTSNKFRQDKKLYFVLGVDVMGKAYYCDLLSGPHMLIAGSSGSGKSVCLNTLICSILFNYKPDYVKFILIDPKGGVEMGVYNDLPHNLLGKAAVTPANTIKALDWAIEEMERRYGLMRDVNVRSWGDYNDKLLAGGLPRQPYILIIIDELADLMASSKKNAGDIEMRIARLTAKARASGIHVIVATQRPSVDVITGTIKNNIPTRVAFKTATQIDSKTILEKGCAEKLYGKGDMYFMSSEFNELKRLQGPFLTDDEVNVICDNIRANNDCLVDEFAAAQIFKEDVEEAKDDTSYDDEDDVDEGEVNEENLFERAVRAVAEQGTVSISRLQRMYRLGFNRAALLVDEMEERGFIDKPVLGSSKPRRVLITPEECDEIFGYGDDDED